MGLLNLLNSGKKKFTTIDVALDELAMVFLALLVAKYWEGAMSLAWYWYVIIIVIAIIKPIMSFLKN